MTKIDLDEIEWKARAATQDEWQWRPEDLGVLEGKHDGQVVLWGNLDAAEADEPLIVVSAGDRQHIAANSPPVTLALIARIRELESALGDALLYELDPEQIAEGRALLEKGVVLR